MPHYDLVQVRYPAATVLLDLTASENCIERVGQLIMERNLMDVVLRELKIALAKKIPKGSSTKIYQ